MVFVNSLFSILLISALVTSYPDIGPGQSYDQLGFCEHSVQKHLSFRECREEILMNIGFQDCLCFFGVFYVEHHHKCQYDTIWSVGGCAVPSLSHLPNGLYDTAYKSIHGIFRRHEVIAAIPSFYEGEVSISWDVARMHQGSQMMFGGYFLNARVVLDSETNNTYCTNPTLETGIVYSYSELKGLISITPSCTGIELEPDFCFPVLTPENSTCNQTCDLQRELALKTSPIPGVPGSLRSLHTTLNRILLQTSIDISFQSDAFTVNHLSKFEPRKSFKVLDQMVEILQKSCQHTRVPNYFIERIVTLFKYLHEGRGYYFSEQFSNASSRSIITLLEHCKASIVPMNFEFDSVCMGEILSVIGPSVKEGPVPITKTYGHQDFDHYHILLDMIWNVVDFYNVVCIDSFAPSYRVYHELEQGMEKLFTEELRNLWVYPGNNHRHFYDRILGLNWRLYIENLDKCIEAAYIWNPKLVRLLRPTWITGKRRLTNKKMILENNEVICGSRKCSTINMPFPFIRMKPFKKVKKQALNPIEASAEVTNSLPYIEGAI